MYQDIENIIYNYKKDLENFDEHRKKYINVLNDIKKYRYNKFTMEFSLSDLGKIFLVIICYNLIGIIVFYISHP